MASDRALREYRLRASESAISIACGVIAALTGLLAMFASEDGALHPSALVKIAGQDPLASLARGADPHFRFVTIHQHYDGAYYYAIARDPFLRGEAHTLIDQPAYRYGHPLHGWLAGLLSLGQARWVPLALLLLGLIGLAVAGWAASRLAVHFRRTPWGGLVIAFSPGLIFAATVDTTETVGAALLALTFLAWVNQRFTVAAFLIVALCLDKEQYVTVPIGLVVWEIVEARRRHGGVEHAGIKSAAVSCGPLVLTGWYLYVHAQLGSWPWTYQPDNFGKPFAGWAKTLQLAHELAGGTIYQSEMGTMTPAVLVVTGLILVLATIVALRVRTVFAVPMIGMAVITSMQGYKTLLYSHELLRTPAIALLLAVAVLFARDGAPSAPTRTTDGDERHG
jgi:hypothetical protein